MALSVVASIKCLAQVISTGHDEAQVPIATTIDAYQVCCSPKLLSRSFPSSMKIWCQRGIKERSLRLFFSRGLAIRWSTNNLLEFKSKTDLVLWSTCTPSPITYQPPCKELTDLDQWISSYSIATSKPFSYKNNLSLKGAHVFAVIRSLAKEKLFKS